MERIKLNIKRFAAGGGAFQIDQHYNEQYDQYGNCTSVLITMVASDDIARVEDALGNDISNEWGSFPGWTASKVYTENITETITFISANGEELTTTIDIFSVASTLIYPQASGADIKINTDIKVGNTTLKDISEKVSGLFDLIYPVGSIYQTTDASFSPNVSFSGTWTQIKDVFLLAAGDTYTGGTSGGAATVQLTEGQLPKISASWAIHGQEGGTIFYTLNGKATGTQYNSYKTTQGGTLSGARSYQNPGIAFGNNESHNNMPPYQVVYTWKRTQ